MNEPNVKKEGTFMRFSSGTQKSHMRVNVPLMLIGSSRIRVIGGSRSKVCLP